VSRGKRTAGVLFLQSPSKSLAFSFGSFHCRLKIIIKFVRLSVQDFGFGRVGCHDGTCCSGCGRRHRDSGKAHLGAFAEEPS